MSNKVITLLTACSLTAVLACDPDAASEERDGETALDDSTGEVETTDAGQDTDGECKKDDDGDDGDDGTGDDEGAGDDDSAGSDGCTLTQGYWKNHDDWPVFEDDVLCGQSWYDILWTETNGDAWYILGHQWIAATLNVAGGASTDAALDAAFAEAEALLVACEISAEDRPAAIELSTVLDAFNNGLVGPGHCDDNDDGDDDGADDGDDDGGDTSGSDTGDATADEGGDVTTAGPVP
jgi:hypothetical protein